MSSIPSLSPIHVTDTHALLWYLTSNKRLSPTALQIFEMAAKGQTRIVISAIVIAELYWIDQKLHVFADFTSTYQQLKATPYFDLIPFNADAVLEFDQDAVVREMHDRIIVGLARRLSVPVITVDQNITDANVVPVL